MRVRGKCDTYTCFQVCQNGRPCCPPLAERSGRVVPVPQLPKYAAHWVRTVMRVAVITPMMWAWSLLPFAGVSSASRVNVPA